MPAQFPVLCACSRRVSDHMGPCKISAVCGMPKQALEQRNILKPGPVVCDMTLASGCQVTGQLFRKMLLLIYTAKYVCPRLLGL